MDGVRYRSMTVWWQPDPGGWARGCVMSWCGDDGGVRSGKGRRMGERALQFNPLRLAPLHQDSITLRLGDLELQRYFILFYLVASSIRS